jgi:hypothetical protein
VNDRRTDDRHQVTLNVNLTLARGAKNI